LAGTDFLEISLPEGYRFDSSQPVESTKVTKLYVQAASHSKQRPRYSTKNPTRADFETWCLRCSTYHWLYEYQWFDIGAKIAKGDSIAITVNLRGVLTDEALLQCRSRNIRRSSMPPEPHTRQTASSCKSVRQTESGAGTRRRPGVAQDRNRRDHEGVLRWLFGSSFSFYPPDLPVLGLDPTQDLPYYSTDSNSVRAGYEAPMLHSAGDSISTAGDRMGKHQLRPLSVLLD